MEHESSILYAPFNTLWHSVQHRYAWDVPDHVIMALLVLTISCVLFPLMSRKISRENPGHFQQMLELVVTGLKGLLNDIIGHDGDRFLYIIGGFAAFIFVSNIFSLQRAIRIRRSASLSAPSSTTTIRGSRRRASCSTSSTSWARC